MSRLSTVIKAGTRATAVGSCHSFQLEDVLIEARKKLAEAKQETATILAQASRQAEAIREEARKQGYQAGFEAGRQAGIPVGRQEAFEAARRDFGDRQQSLIEAYRSAIAQIDAGRAGWLASARRDLIELAMAMARRVAHHVGERERDVVQANLEEAVRLMGRRSDVVLHVNPLDADTARSFAASLIQGQGQYEHVRVAEDAGLSPGGCRVQWGSGIVDASLETQLQRIERELELCPETSGNQDNPTSGQQAHDDD